MHAGSKRLVFVDSRRQAESLGKLLNDAGTLAYVVHGSLSAVQRRDAERTFVEGSDCVIVATSAMELGIDIGDLEHVLQLDAPSTVASFLQRMGRTGRRPDKTPNCTFLATTSGGVLQTAAILDLHARGYVEPVRPSSKAFHIFAHQVMALAGQANGIVRNDLWPWLEGAAPFTAIPQEGREALLDHMLSTQILADLDGRLWLGPEGERVYGRANFRELYAVFSSPRLITVKVDIQEIGQVEAQFLAAMEGPTGALAKVQTKFAEQNPGCALSVSPLRDLRKQVGLWNKNNTIQQAGERLLKDMQAVLKDSSYPDVPTPVSIAKFKKKAALRCGHTRTDVRRTRPLGSRSGACC